MARPGAAGFHAAPIRRQHERRRRLLRHGLPLAALALAALAVGLIVGLGGGGDARALATRYVTAWTRQDFGAMYALLDQRSRQRISETRFARALQADAATATMTGLALRHLEGVGAGSVEVLVRADTRLFGSLSETLRIPVSGQGSDTRVRYSPVLLFPGLRPGERLSRHVALGARGTVLASDGTPLAQGPQRSSPIPDVAGEIVGRLGPIPPAEAAQYAALGYPADARVGLDGLEHVFQDRLAGRPGGTLLAGQRVLARVPPQPGVTVRTTIDPTMERAAVAAAGGRYAAIAVMNPRTGGLTALAGFAFSVLQPPGSTMKIITATAALQAGIVKLTDVFPVATSATLDGVQLQNANGEACGGTLVNAFAVSCNSVFAPLGARLGAARLVAMAERFGFNHPVPIPGAAESTIPPAAGIGDSLAVGSSAIGQGRVQASTLEMTDVAATIAMGGRRPIPTLLADARPQFVRVASPRVAREVQRMMEAVVQFGTGTAAAIPGVKVAGKTGTAELRTTVQTSTGSTSTTSSSTAAANSPKNTDAWFVGYAPVGHPAVVAGALLPSQGAGGTAAAPVVHDVLVAALHAH